MLSDNLKHHREFLSGKLTKEIQEFTYPWFRQNMIPEPRVKAIPKGLLSGTDTPKTTDSTEKPKGSAILRQKTEPWSFDCQPFDPNTVHGEGPTPPTAGEEAEEEGQPANKSTNHLQAHEPMT